MPSRPFIVAALARRSSTINSNFSQARLTLIKRRFPTPDQTTRPGRTALTNTLNLYFEGPRSPKGPLRGFAADAQSTLAAMFPHE